MVLSALALAVFAGAGGAFFGTRPSGPGRRLETDPEAGRYAYRDGWIVKLGR